MKHQITYPVTASALTYISTGYCNSSVRFSNAFQRLFNCLTLMPAEQTVTLQLLQNDSDYYTCYVAGNGGMLTDKDMQWIFSDCAAVDNSRSVTLDSLFKDGSTVYAVCPDDECRADAIAQEAPSTRAVSELMRELTAEKATLRLHAVSGRFAQGTPGILCLSIPQTMTLRLRAMLTSFFPGCHVTEVADEETLPFGALEPIAGRFGTLLSEAVRIETELARGDARNNPPSANPDSAADILAPLDVLGLSVRAYNILRRSGIDSVAALCETSDETLMTLRNMGHKSFHEIKEKLAAYLETPQIEFPLDDLEDLLTESDTDETETQDNTDYYAMLGELIGLNEVKEQVRRIAAFAKLKKAVSENGGNDIPITLNMQFVGNPGTAKTTVARIMAGILYQTGLLRNSQPLEVGRADLVAKYVGHTAAKVKEVFEKAEGRLLFIDEAYSLLEDREGCFGDEAINAIVQEMENRRGSTVVVFAGYGKEMATFLARNPGLRSRVPFTITFSDYSAEEMAEIAVLQAKKLGFRIHPDAIEVIKAVCEEAKKQDGFGNGRFCRTLVEGAVLAFAERTCGNVQGDDLPAPDLVLLSGDFPTATQATAAPSRRPIGF